MHLETIDVIREESDGFYGPKPFLADDVEVPCSVPVADCVDANGQPILDGSLTALTISAEVLLTQGETPQLANVLSQYINKNGKVIGNYKKNPLLNTLVYDVELPDGAVKNYAANIIAENMLAQCDQDGFYTNVMEVILDHKRDRTAVPMSEKYFMTKQGSHKMRQSNLGW